MPWSLGSQCFSLGFGVRWDSAMGTCQAHRRPGRCHHGRPGKSSFSEGYHLLHFCCIKSPGDMPRRSDTVGGYCIYCFWNRDGSVTGMQASNTSSNTQSLSGYPVHTCCLVMVGWMAEVYQTLHSPSTFQSCSVLCAHRIMPCPFLFTATLQKSALNIHISSFIWPVRSSLLFFVYLVCLGWYFIITQAIEGNDLKKITMSSISISSILKKNPSKILSVAINGVGTLVSYSCHGNLELMLLNNFVSDFKQRNLAFDGITRF